MKPDEDAMPESDAMPDNIRRQKPKLQQSELDQNSRMETPAVRAEHKANDHLQHDIPSKNEKIGTAIGTGGIGLEEDSPPAIERPDPGPDEVQQDLDQMHPDAQRVNTVLEKIERMEEDNHHHGTPLDSTMYWDLINELGVLLYKANEANKILIENNKHLRANNKILSEFLISRQETKEVLHELKRSDEIRNEAVIKLERLANELEQSDELSDDSSDEHEEVVTHRSPATPIT